MPLAGPVPSRNTNAAPATPKPITRPPPPSLRPGPGAAAPINAMKCLPIQGAMQSHVPRAARPLPPPPAGPVGGGPWAGHGGFGCPAGPSLAGSPGAQP